MHAYIFPENWPTPPIHCSASTTLCGHVVYTTAELVFLVFIVVIC